MGRRNWPVVLHSWPVTLRPIRARDEAAWLAIRQRGAMWFSPWDSTRPPGIRERAVTFSQQVRDFNTRARRGEMLPFAIDYQRDNGDKPEFVGQVTISGIAYGPMCWAQIGYWVDPQVAGRGIVPRAVALAVDYCFASLGLHRVEAAVRPENDKSLAVVRKLGFRDEGVRERYMHVRGAWRDHRVFSLTADDVPEGVLVRFNRHSDEGRTNLMP